MECVQWKKELARASGNEKEHTGKFQEQEQTKSRNEMRKPSKKVRCTLLNGSVWSTEKMYMRRYKGAFVTTFSGIEHRMRKEAMEEQFNKR